MVNNNSAVSCATRLNMQFYVSGDYVEVGEGGEIETRVVVAKLLISNTRVVSYLARSDTANNN